MATTTKFYVYSTDTSTGTAYQIKTTSTWNGPGVLVGGPFATMALAQAWIKPRIGVDVMTDLDLYFKNALDEYLTREPEAICIHAESECDPDDCPCDCDDCSEIAED